MWRVCCAQMGSCCAGVFLLRSGPCCVARILCVAKPCCSMRGQALLRGLFCVRPGTPTAGRVSAPGFPVCMTRRISPRLILTEFFPPFPGARGNLCAETSYLRGQCLCGRADVWSARAVGATILDVFCYGLPTESGLGSQWRYCCFREREVGNHSEKDMGSLGKFAFIPPSHLKI